MSENVVPSSEDRARAQASSVAQMSGGAMLRQAREAQGLDMASLAVSLKVPVRKLEALEADRFDLLPDIVFVRALAASVCRTLKIDPGPVLEGLPATTSPRLKTDESGINTPFRVSGAGSGLAFWDQLSRPFVLAVLVLLVGVIVLVFFPFASRIEDALAPKSESASEMSALSAPTSALIATENLVVAEAALPSRASIPATSGVDAALAKTPASMTSSAPLSAQAVSALAVTVPGSGATSGMVILKALGSSWVEVVDASGVVQVRKTLTNGEVVGVSGVMPLSVVVGRADTIEVQVRGKPFDLTRIAKDNVARFEVK